MTSVPHSARVVVIGGGVMGCSTAYHLAKLGCRGVALDIAGRQAPASLDLSPPWDPQGLRLRS